MSSLSRHKLRLFVLMAIVLVMVFGVVATASAATIRVILWPSYPGRWSGAGVDIYGPSTYRHGDFPKVGWGAQMVFTGLPKGAYRVRLRVFDNIEQKMKEWNKYPTLSYSYSYSIQGFSF